MEQDKKVKGEGALSISTYIHTYIHKLYLSSDFSVAYIASISDPN